MDANEAVDYFELAVNILPVVVAVASAVSALTPNTWDNKVAKILRKVSNVLAINVGHAKPAEEVLEEQRRSGRPGGG